MIQGEVSEMSTITAGEYGQARLVRAETLVTPSPSARC